QVAVQDAAAVLIDDDLADVAQLVERGFHQAALLIGVRAEVLRVGLQREGIDILVAHDPVLPGVRCHSASLRLISALMVFLRVLQMSWMPIRQWMYSGQEIWKVKSSI